MGSYKAVMGCKVKHRDYVNNLVITAYGARWVGGSPWTSQGDPFFNDVV